MALKRVKKQATKRENGILRYPRLDTVLMVEETIKEHDGEYKKKALWQALPKKMMYQTYCVIIDYLLYSRKISIDAEGKIGWLHTISPELLVRSVPWRRT